MTRIQHPYGVIIRETKECQAENEIFQTQVLDFRFCKHVNVPQYLFQFLFSIRTILTSWFCYAPSHALLPTHRKTKYHRV